MDLLKRALFNSFKKKKELRRKAKANFVDPTTFLHVQLKEEPEECEILDPLCSLETIDEVDETDEEFSHTPQKSPTSTKKEHSRNKIKSFDCKTCNKTFTGAKGLAKHEEKHTKHQSKKYTSSSEDKKSQRREDNFRCKVCDKKFGRKLSLIRHQVNHSKVSRSKKDIPLAKPSEKDVMFVDTEDSINPELASCQDDPISIDLGKSKPFLCTDCDKSHSDYNKLLIHIKKYHAVKKSLKPRSNGTKHKIRVTKEKPEFKIGDIKSIYDEIAMNCNTLLDSSFSDEDVEIVGSPKKTGKETSKAGQKPYSCEVCDKSYETTTSLRRHKKKHQLVTPHVVIL